MDLEIEGAATEDIVVIVEEEAIGWCSSLFPSEK
jgi:hypothetical protein